MTLVEVIVVTAVLVLASSLFLQMMVSTARLRSVTHERALAADAAWTVLESMRHRPFEEIFATFNPDPGDDPEGKGSAPGHLFRVPGLSPLPGAVDGTIGEIVMPCLPRDEAELKKKEEQAKKKAEKEAEKRRKKGQEEEPEEGVQLGGLFFPARPDLGDFQLREDYDDFYLGTPRDLNGDNVLDKEDHAKDYVRLPVCVRLAWTGPAGPMKHRIYTMFAANQPPSVAANTKDETKKKKK